VFLSQAQRARWSIYRIDRVTLFAYNPSDSVGALAEKLGTAKDPFTKMEALEARGQAQQWRALDPVA
jgi:hypothetical protein